MSKTIGESKIFEGRMITKSEIVKMHVIFKSFLKAQKRHVHETVENVTPAQRCKTKEIGTKYESLKYIREVSIFWPTGAETMENVTF